MREITPEQEIAQAHFESMSGFEVPADNIEVPTAPKEYHQKLLKLIKNTKNRIYLSLLYIENDEVGNEILQALAQKKQENPEIDIQIFLDHNRAQRGRSDNPEDKGILPILETLNSDKPAVEQLNITTVQIAEKEGNGVFHPKGMVFDDTLLYSGAAASNKYCHVGKESRLDTYVLFKNNPELANCFVEQMLIDFKAKVGKIVDSVEGFKLPEEVETLKEDCLATPLIGKGAENEVNETMLNALASAEKKITLYTPYLNLPDPLQEKIREALDRGCEVKIVVGDKEANDWWLQPEDSWKTTKSGLWNLCKLKFGLASMQLFGRTLPFFYEQQLKAFSESCIDHLESGKLNISLWKDGKNSTHTKRMEIDDGKIVILTGSNMNKRSWDKDLENAIVLQNLTQSLIDQFQKEQQTILENTEKIDSPDDLPDKKDYSPFVRTGIFAFGLHRKKI